MTRSRIPFAAILLTMLAAGPLFAAQKAAPKSDKSPANRPAVTSLPPISPALHTALQDQRYEAAVAIIDRELAKPSVHADYLLYLKGRAHAELKEYAAALKTFESLELRFPKSRWVARARFGRADVFARQRDYKSAGTIYRAEAQRLLSDKRQDELTGIYLEFADRYFEGIPAKEPGAERKPDYKQALTYYGEALKLRSGLRRRQKIEFRIARCQQELKQFPAAIQSYRAFLKEYAGKDTRDERRAEAKLEVEARFQLGRSLLDGKQPAEARRVWQDFLAGGAAKKAGGDFIAKATYQLALTYGIPSPSNSANLELGVAALEKFLKQFPKHKLAAKAEYEIAESYLSFGRYEEAVGRLKKLIGNPAYKQAAQVADARRLLGETYLAQKKFQEAIAAFREFLEAHPTDRNWSAVQKRVIDAEFYAAAEQRTQKHYDAARKLWSTFLNKYPLDSRAPQILFAFGGMKYAAAVQQHVDALRKAKEAGRKVDPRKLAPAVTKLFEDAMADWKRLVSKYPSTNEASHGAYMIGVTLEDYLGRLPDALEAYRKVTGAYASVAQARIKALTAKKLDVLTERKFRSNEKPVIKLRTRNLESVTIKTYRIDMVDYFRKMHLASGVETLDIALIDPDKTKTYKVEGFEKYRQLVNEVPIDVNGPGVTAVTVSAVGPGLRAGLEATTMIVVSDIDLIVKASRNELFVFAENMRTQKPAAGVSLLVSDGKTVFAEELTGKNGVLQKSYEQLKTVKDLRVFAVQQGHAASTVSNLEGLNFAVGLAPKGYLYTDRPAYRAGELVNLKGIVRWVENDTYTFKPGEKYKLHVYDARGRVIHTADVALGKFGTFADRLMLPPSAPQGDYRVHLHQPGGKQSYETIFSVHEIKLEPIQLVVDLPRKVYYRGEKIDGTITLKYYYGTPLADRSLQYRLADGRVHTATTDAKGQVKFAFETAKFNESQQLAVTAVYAERNIGAAVPVFIATRGFAVQVTTRRGTYIAGETFDAAVKLADPAGKPVAKDLKLEVFQLLPAALAAGGKGEKLVSTYKIKTDKEKGEARQTLRIDKAGYYRLRATGTDRFGNSVSGQHVVKISGDNDHIRLRILADKHNFKVGDTAKVQLHWREAPALALVTFEGAKVLSYRLVTLKKGANALSLPMAAKFAPNFVLSVAVMEKNRFHQAHSEFLVSRKLNVALKPAKGTYKPGDELKVEITTTDPQGKPVSAELSLGLIQKNLLDRFGERQGIVNAFFGGGYRVPSVRAFTSATFRYRPTTRGISKYLLAEAERQKILEAEVRVREQLAMQAPKAPPAIMAGEPGDGGFFEAPPNVGGDRSIFPRGGTIVGLAAPDFELAEANSRRAVDLPPGDFAYVQGFNELMQQKRYAAAESIAKQLRDRNPDSPAAEVMYWRARFGRRIASDGKLVASKEDAMWHTLNEVEQSAIPYFGKPMQFSDSKVWKELKERRRKWAGVDLTGQQVGQGQPNAPGNDSDKTPQITGYTVVGGVNNPSLFKNINEFDNLSLVIRQTQTVQDERLLKDLSNTTDGTIVALAQNGEYQVVNGLPVKKLEALTRDGLRVLPAMAAAETGYWNPAVVTGKDGKAVVTFRLPNRSTAWKLRAKGTDAGVLTGQAEADVISRKDLFGAVKTPLAFYRGDKASVLVEVHNAVVKKGEKIAVSLETTIGNRTTKTTKTVTSTGPGIAELAFPVEITEGDTAEFKLTVTSVAEVARVRKKPGKAPKGKAAEFLRIPLRDTSTAAVPVRAFGLPVFATASGSSAQNTIAFVAHDKRLDVQEPTMEILIGPGINRTLLDAVLGGGATRCESRFVAPGSSIERTVSDAIGGVALLKMVRATRNTNTPEAQALSGRVQGAVAALVSLQRDDGGWSWSGRPSAASHRFLTSRAVWALAAARKAGFAVPEDTLNKAVQYLRTQFTKSSTQDREGQAILLHGLAKANAADFAFANRLYRERNVLSASGLLHVALVLIELDRKQMAGDLLKLVKLPVDKNGDAKAVFSRVLPWMHSGVELRALYLLALQAVSPGDKRVGQLADWLLAARRGSRWSPEKANGPAVAALAEWFARSKFVSEKYTLSVIVNGGLVKKIEVDPSKDGSRRLQVPAKLLVNGKGKQQKINFDMTGRGRFSYSVVLGGFVPADKLKSTTPDWSIVRHYEPAPRMLDGETIPRGFGILTAEHQRTKRFRNPLTQLPLGERGEVTLRLSRSDNAPQRDGEREYLVITEPIPAGCSVVQDSIRGGFERYEILPGAITFYVGERAAVEDIHYTLVGYLPGQFRAAPTVVRSFYQPARIVVSGIKPLETLARGEKSKDKYRLSPVELFEFGKRYFAKRQYKQADAYLTQLFTNYGLRRSVFGEVVKLLFRTSLEVRNDAAVVEFFEIIKERYPDEVINFDEILQTADAYRKLGEYERAYLVFRSTIEASFQRESQIAGFLDARGEFLRSVQIMENLLADYPAESYIATATYALAQEVYGKAAEVATNKKLRDAGLTKAGLIGANVKMLDHFLSTWPKDPAVDQAAFAMANSYLDLEDYKSAIARCEKFAQRYPKSKLLDSFWYVIGYSQFALGRTDAALKMCRKVAETKHKDPDTGVEVAAANKWQAIYIMGQVYHSLGKPADAITEYTRVENRFPDAKQSIEFFTRKAIKLPEVTTIKPGGPATVDLNFRNVASANVKVYRIDLLKFGLMQRNLNRITAINLAGIRPFHELTLKLGDGKDYRDRKRALALPLKKEGAYLVVCRGESLYASGLVLVSPLELQIQEDAESGRVRVTVKDRTADKYARNVEVKVIGSANPEFVSGETDLRGIFVADAIRGTSTVIARSGEDRYAFFRGKTALGSEPKKSPAAAKPGGGKGNGKGDGKSAEKQTGKDALLDQLKSQNSSFNNDQRRSYRNLLQNKAKGVKVKKAF